MPMFKSLLASTPKNNEKEVSPVGKADFLNIPVQLLSGFLDDTRMSIRDIYYYALYAHFIKLDKGTDKEKYRATCEWFNFKELDREENLKHGKVLFERYPNSPMTGIDRNLYSEYNKLEKSDFDKACFFSKPTHESEGTEKMAPGSIEKQANQQKCAEEDASDKPEIHRFIDLKRVHGVDDIDA